MTFNGYYVHIPWCRRRCPYCDFYLKVGDTPTDNFFKALKKELLQKDPGPHYQNASSLYFGGGTPSLASPNLLEAFVDDFFQTKRLNPKAEITLEVNPEDINETNAPLLKQANINRISLGLQSLHDPTLRFLGRKHTSKTALKAIEILQKAGFTNISADLIIGTPQEEISTVLNSLKELAFLGIPHISPYLLTIEQGTNFHRRINKGSLKAPSNDAQAETYSQVQDFLLSNSYVQYEISSYAMNNHQSRHNQLYWSFSSYLGLGPSACSMMVQKDGSILRAQNEPSLSLWQINQHKINLETIPPQEAFLEAAAFGLRNLEQGIDLKALSLKFKVSIPPSLPDILEKFKIRGWIKEKKKIYHLTSKGALFGDFIMREVFCCK